MSGLAYITVNNQLTAKTTEQIDSIATKQEQRLNALLQDKEEGAIKLALVRYDLQDAYSRYLASRKEKDRKTIETILQDKRNDTPGAQVYLTETSGKVVASTLTNAPTQLDASYIAIELGEQSNITLQEDASDGINKLFAVSKVFVNKQEVGRLLIVYKLDDLVAIIQDYTGLGKTGETLLAARDSKGVPTSLFPLRFDQAATQKTKLRQLHLFGKSGVYTDGIDYRGRTVIVATRVLSNANWALATKIDASEALAQIANLRNLIILNCLAVAVVIAVAALYFTRYLTAPIIALTEKAQQIRLGNLRQRIAVTSKDEVGALAVTFNEMAQQVAESYEALEQKVAERTKELDQKVSELETSKAKDEAILASIGDGLVVTDGSGKVLLINAIAAELLAVDQAKIVGQNITKYDLYDDSDNLIPQEDRPMQMALSTGRKVIQDVKSLQNETKRALSITASPVTQQGKIIGTIQTIRDITKEKEIDRMKTEFISIASHQLRTPLSAIKWFTEMLLSGDAGKLQKEQADFAQNIADSTERMIELVSSLLNISRLESGRIIVDPKPTDLSKLVNGIINDLKGKTEEKKQTLIISVHKDLPIINLDPHLIGQVYLNLLTNAIKYTPTGGEISVLISRKGDEVISQVSDTGYGIPKAEQGKMFRKFFRATNIVKVESDGTGLGMYLVKSIIESSGGKIWFESEENKGTTFWFSIPITGMKAKAGEVTLGS